MTENKTAPIVIAMDGTSASGKSTNARLIARELGYVYVDTGAMYRTLAWYCMVTKVNVDDARAVAAACRKWKTKLVCVEGELRQARLVVLNSPPNNQEYYPEKEIRTDEVSKIVPKVAAVPKVRVWMKKTQRDCIQFGNLVMEGRDIGTNVFPETNFKFYLDAKLSERSRRREADGVQEDLAKRDHQDSQRAAAPLMIPLGAIMIDNSGETPAQTSSRIIAEFKRRQAQCEADR